MTVGTTAAAQQIESVIGTEFPDMPGLIMATQAGMALGAALTLEDLASCLGLSDVGVGSRAWGSGSFSGAEARCGRYPMVASPQG